MSHFATVNVEWKDAECIRSAIADAYGVGLDQVLYDPHKIQLRDYTGHRLNRSAQIVLKREHIGAGCADLGVEQHPDGSWEIHVDWYNQRRNRTDTVNAMKKAYTIAVLKKQAAKDKFRYKQEVRSDGKTVIRLTRSSFKH